METMIAAYDVSDDNRRARLAALLQAHGDRIQRSVFRLTGRTSVLEGIITAAHEFIDPRQDSLFFVPVCVNCRDGTSHLGQSAPHEPVLTWIVL